MGAFCNMDTRQILNERKTTHGDFTDNARISQSLKNVVKDAPLYPELSDIQKEALYMILHKISRIVAGNPNHTDSWIDISGYSTLVADRLSTD